MHVELDDGLCTVCARNAAAPRCCRPNCVIPPVVVHRTIGKRLQTFVVLEPGPQLGGVLDINGRVARNRFVRWVAGLGPPVVLWSLVRWPLDRELKLARGVSEIFQRVQNAVVVVFWVVWVDALPRLFRQVSARRLPEDEHVRAGLFGCGCLDAQACCQSWARNRL